MQRNFVSSFKTALLRTDAVSGLVSGGVFLLASVLLLCLLLVSLYSNFKHMFGGVGSHSSLPSRAGIPRLEESMIEDNDSTNKIAVIDLDGIITVPCVLRWLFASTNTHADDESGFP